MHRPKDSCFDDHLQSSALPLSYRELLPVAEHSAGQVLEHAPLNEMSGIPLLVA